ncbi:MAG: pyridoxal-phosphate dependent enzyme [Oceanicoccus sp.]
MPSLDATRQFANLQTLDDPVFQRAGIHCSVLRLDTFSSFANGNKFFKLKHNILQAKAQGFDKILSFGGAYSNHIHALALAGRHFGMSTVGIIRGDDLPIMNPTLTDAVAAGMNLKFISRRDYKRRNDAGFLDDIKVQYPDFFVVPEGGSNVLGVQGCMEIVDHIYSHGVKKVDLIVVPCGTAATLAGIAASCEAGEKVLGFSVLKNGQYLDTEVEKFISDLSIDDRKNWSISHDYHCGGYAKLSSELMSFIDNFQRRHDIPIEPVYSGKMFFGLNQMLQASSCPIAPGSHVVAIHTGGLQGWRGMATKIQHKE